MSVLVGCDPEVFVYDMEEERYVSAHGMIEGTKENPQLVDGGMVQVDGMALEFGIDPADSVEKFCASVNAVQQQLKEMIPSKYRLVATPSVTFDQDVYDSQPPEALELGCEPDFNAYTQQQNPTPVAPARMRSGGGHIHVGWGSDLPEFDKRHLEACSALSIAMDRKLGVPSLSWDSDIDRRRIYGGAGAFRPKPYGMEYRTLSNAWLNSEETMAFVFRQTVDVVKRLQDGDNSVLNPTIRFYNSVRLSVRSIIEQTSRLPNNIIRVLKEVK